MGQSAARFFAAIICCTLILSSTAHADDYFNGDILKQRYYLAGRQSAKMHYRPHSTLIKGFLFGITSPLALMGTASLASNYIDNNKSISAMCGIIGYTAYSMAGYMYVKHEKIKTPSNNTVAFMGKYRKDFENGYRDLVMKERNRTYYIGFLAGPLLISFLTFWALSGLDIGD